MTNESKPTAMGQYSLLGRSGLRVSPFCLGTMTFGTDWGWGAPEETSREIFRRYVEVGGNFIDTADGYTNGTSETLLGKFMAEDQLRDRLVVATKFTFTGRTGDPNAGGNGRKNIHRALEGSLRRLGTDYVDLYWLHCHDGVTPVEEVVRTLDDLVSAGKIRAVGLSNTPGWYLARYQTMADLRGFERVAALQPEYSLVERSIEPEFVPAVRELGIGICPWSPLALGFLTGKYQRREGGFEGQGRLDVTRGATNPIFQKFTPKNWEILETVSWAAKELGKSPAQIALNWVTTQPAVTSTILGATKRSQLEDNLFALDFAIPGEIRAKLDEVSRPKSQYPYNFFEPGMRKGIDGGTKVFVKPQG